MVLMWMASAVAGSVEPSFESGEASPPAPVGWYESREERRTPRQRKGRTLKITGFALFGVGSTISLGGGGLALFGAAMCGSSGGGDCFPFDLVMVEGLVLKLPGQVLAGAGGGLIAAGYSLEKPEKIVVVPWISEDGGGLVAVGRW